MGDRDLEIDGLIDEHRELMTIMASLRRAADQPHSEVDGLLGELTTTLARHTEREEAGLFHTLREVEIPPEYMGLFEHDHGHLVDLIESAKRDRHGVTTSSRISRRTWLERRPTCSRPPSNCSAQLIGMPLMPLWCTYGRLRTRAKSPNPTADHRAVRHVYAASAGQGPAEGARLPAIEGAGRPGLLAALIGLPLVRVLCAPASDSGCSNARVR